MGKSDGFLTAKAIGNRMKAKGLQKLRWFCQVCQKQCRDENGFKCHTTSESHQRQMLIVANNPDKFLSSYSNEFEAAFLENLRRRHGTKRMAANVVYNEFIADKLHVHMNATQWTTLASFVQYLGRTGKCVVDETEKGWFMQYIDRDPRTLARQEELEKKKKAELDHEERNRLFIERQLKLAQDSTAEKLGDDADPRPTKLMRKDGDAKISISLAPSDAKDGVPKIKSHSVANVFSQGVAEPESSSNDRSRQQSSRALEAMAHDFEQQQKSHDSRKRRRDDHEDAKLDYWITPGIVVKVMNKRVGNGQYYQQKGEVIGVKDRYGAKVEMLESGDVLQLDQDDLETVIPKVGRNVKIVNGIGRGNIATLLSISVEEYTASIRIESGSRRGEVLDRVEYEWICRLADEPTQR